MDRLIQLMEGLNISGESIQIDELIDKLRDFDIAASNNKESDDDLMSEEMSDDLMSDEETLDDLCNRFESVTLDNSGIYIKHVSGKIMFIPYGQCGLYHKISIGMKIPRWTTVN